MYNTGNFMLLELRENFLNSYYIKLPVYIHTYSIVHEIYHTVVHNSLNMHSIIHSEPCYIILLCMHVAVRVLHSCAFI